MDSQTQRELAKITKGIPKNLTTGLSKVVVDHSQEDVVKEALKDKTISNEAKQELRLRMARGDFRTEEVVENHKKIAELDRYHTTKVQQAMRDGKLADPHSDPFFRKRMERMIKK